MTRLAIVIVSFNARDDLAGTLASLTAAPPAASHEIVVVDNASTDGAPALVRERFPAVRVIDAGGNLGFARANNIGIRATTSELVLLLNPDTIVPAGRDRRDGGPHQRSCRTSTRSGRAWSTSRAARSCPSARCTAPGPKRGASSRWRSTRAALARCAAGSTARHAASAWSIG